MFFSLTPAALPVDYGSSIVSDAEVKAHLRVLHDDEDDLIGALRDAAVDMVEKYTNLRLLQQESLTATFAEFGERMRLPVGPLAHLAVTGIAYTDAAGDAATLTEAQWRLEPDGRIMPAHNAEWPDHLGPVTVTYTAGYPASECPSALKAAVKMFTAHLFVHREAVVTGTITAEIPLGFSAICGQYRLMAV